MRARIPEKTDMAIEQFNDWQTGIAGKLLKAIERFEDPEEGFRIWQNFYQDGRMSALRQTVSEAALKDFTPQSSRHSGHMPPHIAEVVYGMVATTRHIRDPEMETGSLWEVINPYLKVACEEHLLDSLEHLREVVGKPLLDLAQVETLRDEMIATGFARFDRIANQAYATPPAGSRRPLRIASSHAPSGLRFGVEIEGFVPLDTTQMQQEELFERLQDAGIPTNQPIHGNKWDDAYEQWSIDLEISIINPLQFAESITGVELVSPILEGENGIQQMKAVLSILEDVNFQTNETCALHIHVDMTDVPLEERKNLAKAFVANEAALDAFTHPERRGGGSIYAHSHSAVSLEDIDAAQSSAELVKVMSGGDRNYKFDITNFDFPGAPQTVQYRGEGGVGYLDSAVDYTLLMLNFTEQALKNPDITVDEVLESLKPQKSFTADVKTRRAINAQTAQRNG